MFDEINDSSNYGYEMYDALSVTSLEKRCGGEMRSPWFSAEYRIYYVTDGQGSFMDREVVCGDVIFAPPACSVLPDGENIEYVAVLAKGGEMKGFADKLGFSKGAKIFPSLTGILSLWRSVFEFDFTARMLRAKGLIYYTVSEIFANSSAINSAKSILTAAEQVKLYIDSNFTRADITLKQISDALSYHPNYVSKMFNNRYRVGISKYINIQRVRYACSLMEEGESSLENVSSLCGFTDEEYFAVVFKRQMGETPRDYMKRLRNPGTAM